MRKPEIIDRTETDLKIMGISMSEWLRKFELPIHLYSAEIIKYNINSFKKVFSQLYPKGEIRYASKACTHPDILKIAGEEGIGSDVISHHEAKCALDAGISPTDLDLNGNCKEDSLIKMAIDSGMLIIADSFEEFEIISEIAFLMSKKAKTLLRISGFEIKNVTAESVFTAGKWTKFGASLNDVPEFLKTLNKYKNIDFLGFHTHIGSQITSIEPYLFILGKLIELGLLLKEITGVCKIINIGGGFPVSYLNESDWERLKNNIYEGHLASQNGNNEKIFSWNNFSDCYEKDANNVIMKDKWFGVKYYSKYPKSEMLEAILKSEIIVNGKSITSQKALKMLEEPVLTIEPGRSIMEDSGVTLARVSNTRKVAGGHNLVTVEMGVVNLCDVMLENTPNKWEIVNEHKRIDNFAFETFIGGNLCFSGDMLTRFKVPLCRKPVRGDILIIHDTGSYTSHFLASNGNSFPRPARVLVFKDKTIRIMKERDTYKDIFSIS